MGDKGSLERSEGIESSLGSAVSSGRVVSPSWCSAGWGHHKGNLGSASRKTVAFISKYSLCQNTVFGGGGGF